MPAIDFVVRGQVMDAEMVRKTADKARPKQPKQAEPKHGGFAVMGWPTGYIDAARQKHEARYARRREWIDEAPKPWDEHAWRATNKLQRLATRATPDGADALAALAKKSGWTEVSVLEVIRGKR